MRQLACLAERVILSVERTEVVMHAWAQHILSSLTQRCSASQHSRCNSCQSQLHFQLHFGHICIMSACPANILKAPQHNTTKKYHEISALAVQQLLTELYCTQQHTAAPCSAQLSFMTCTPSGQQLLRPIAAASTVPIAATSTVSHDSCFDPLQLPAIHDAVHRLCES